MPWPRKRCPNARSKRQISLSTHKTLNAPHRTPLQQSLDLGAPRAEKGLVKTSRTTTPRTRVNKPTPVADEQQTTPCAGDGTPVAESLQCESSRQAEEQPATLSPATSVRHIPASALQNSANALGIGATLPAFAPRPTDVPLAERVALSVEEAGALLGISRDLAYDLVARGELPSVRLGRRLVVPRRALEGTLDRLSQAE